MQCKRGWTRRSFLTMAGAAGLALGSIAAPHRAAAAGPPPETTHIRLAYGPWVCYAAQLLAEDLLRLEGFDQIEIVRHPETYVRYLTQDHSDLAIFGAPQAVTAIDAGDPIVMLTGLHAGCWELFVRDPVTAVRDLVGARVAIIGPGMIDHAWLSAITAYLGVDPRVNIRWVSTGSLAGSKKAFEDGSVDAFIAFPPQPQYLRRSGIGRVLVNTTTDRPWSQHFCCMAASSRRFVDANPVATQRALRALLKAVDLCASQPESAARLLVQKGHEPDVDIALEVLRSVSYKRWREWDPEDTMRFHALRLYDAGMVKSTPQAIIARGTDFSFVRALRQELKA